MDRKEQLKIGFTILIVVTIGFVCLNQATGFFLKAQLLTNPCEVCYNSDRNVQTCIDQYYDRPSIINLSNLTGYNDPTKPNIYKANSTN